MSSSDSYGPPADEDEWARLSAITAQAFAGEEDHYAAWLHRLGPGRTRALRRDGRIAAGLMLYPMGQYFGGRRVPTWGIAGVSVGPAFRGHGLGRELMTAALGEMQRAGVPLSTLYPATQPLYRRLGWELGGMRSTYEAELATLEPARAGADGAEAVSLRELQDEDDGVVRELYARAAVQLPGHLDRCNPLWERLKRPPTGGRIYGYLVEQERQAVGYVIYSQQREVPTNMKYRLAVRDWVFHTPQAGHRLLQLLGHHRSVVDRVRLWLGAHAPILHLTREQVLQPVERFDWMVRVVDVERALEARGWPAGLSGAVRLRVLDDVLEHNTACYELEVADGAGRARRVDSAECEIDVRGLASLFTGRAGPAELRRIGYLRGDEGRDPWLAALFAGPPPWMPDYF